MEQIFGFLVFLALGGTGLASSVKIINQGNSALVERLGGYNKRLEPGVNLIVPFIDKVVYRETIREKVLDIPPQQCITRDNVSISADAVVYWRIVDMEKAYYKVENLRMAMVNLVLTQIRAEMGKLELDETFTARSQINEALLQDLDVSTEPWGVKVNRVELRDIIPSKAVQESMEMQMAAERRKRAAILTSEGEREASVNTARGSAEAQVLEAEAMKKSAVLAAEAEQQSIILKAEADRQNSLLRAQGTAAAMQVVATQLRNDERAIEALQYLIAQNYLDMGTVIGRSNSSKVMFMDPRTIPATMEGIRSLLDDNSRQA
jgi:regulator of protease activity HflC (stomatin/prohibitin superfamily)